MVLVAVLEEKVAGWLHAHASEALESGFRAEIVGLVVSEGYRRRGVGRVLVQHAEQWARDIGAEAIVATLVRVGDVGSVVISDRLGKQGAKRFAIAHELGHWQMHLGLSQEFFCTAAQMREYRNSGPELEANTFAMELLMPSIMVERLPPAGEPDWKSVETLRDRFDVTLTAAVLRYVELSSPTMMAVFSDGGNVKWWRTNSPKVDGIWLASKQRISRDSVAHRVATGWTTDRVDFEPVPWDTWFPHVDPWGSGIHELAIRVDGRGTIMSLIWLRDCF
jgi:Zn-dependent peptidase ImmA (M78 family)